MRFSSGQGRIEYAFVLLIFAVVVATLLLTMGDAIKNVFFSP